ncbi:MAG: DinB family protein [Candidatus Heimdallarchaeota archaeon]
MVLLDHLMNAISSGFHGKWTHLNPQKALAGLTSTIAKKKPNKIDYSCWDLLHHIVFWQDVIIRQLKGDLLDWNELEKKENWPSPESMLDDSNFHQLLDRFSAGIKEAQNLLGGVDFSKTAGKWPELSAIKLYMVLLQHTSYHIGQIIVIRKYLGEWPTNT